MNAKTTDLLTAARSLSVDDRRELVNALIETIPAEEGTRDAWVAECRSRLAAYDRGDSKAIPLTDVFPELRGSEV